MADPARLAELERLRNAAKWQRYRQRRNGTLPPVPRCENCGGRILQEQPAGRSLFGLLAGNPGGPRGNGRALPALPPAMAPVTCHRWLVTLRLDPTRTRDVLIPGRSEWSAGWLAHLLHPGVEVLVVRPAERGQGAP